MKFKLRFHAIDIRVARVDGHGRQRKSAKAVGYYDLDGGIGVVKRADIQPKPAVKQFGLEAGLIILQVLWPERNNLGRCERPGIDAAPPESRRERRVGH